MLRDHESEKQQQHCDLNSKVVIQSKSYLFRSVMMEKSTVSTVAWRHHWFTKREMPGTKVGEDPHRKLQENAMQVEKKCYPLQKLIHALKQNGGPHVQEKKRSCTAVNFD